jgi:hypothetical protein
MVTTSAKITKTRTTVQKLNVAMLQIFEAYEEEFAAIKNKVNDIAEEYKKSTGKELPEEERQKIAAHFIRDLMRMEMPQSWAEVQTEPLEMAGGYAVEDSPLRQYYLQHGQTSSTGEVSSSELLFLIIQNLKPEALEAFHGSEVADTTGNGLLEFVDAWGKPIRFLRWAPAFTDSDYQQNVLKGIRNPNRNTWEGLLHAKIEATENHPDLLDERVNLVDGVVGWFLYPLIYSAGPDGIYGLDEGEDSLELPTVEEDGFLNPFVFPYGMPKGSSHFDNIHNHQWYRSF